MRRKGNEKMGMGKEEGVSGAKRHAESSSRSSRIRGTVRRGTVCGGESRALTSCAPSADFPSSLSVMDWFRGTHGTDSGALEGTHIGVLLP